MCSLVALLAIAPTSRLLPIPLINRSPSQHAAVCCGALGSQPRPLAQLVAASGLSKAEQRKWIEAAALLRAALQSNPSRVSGWFKLAMCANQARPPRETRTASANLHSEICI